MLRIPSKPLSILLVDDHPVLRLGFALLLKKLDDAAKFHEAGTRAEALELAAWHQPAVILLDLTLEQEIDLALIDDLHGVAPDAAIIVVSMHDERFYAERAFQAGAKGYVMKNDAARCITDAVRTVLEGGVWRSEELRNAVEQGGAESVPGSDYPAALATLSDLERAVLRLIGHGLKKAEIAARLDLPLETVENCKAGLREKLGIDSGAALYRFAAMHPV